MEIIVRRRLYFFSFLNILLNFYKPLENMNVDMLLYSNNNHIVLFTDAMM